MEISWTEVLKIALGVIAALGGGGAIVAGLSSWLGKVWADRLMVKETAKFREDLERLTKQLERKNYVSKVRFDAEFAIYRELCANTDEMERAVYMLFPAGIDHLPKDEEQKKAMFAERYKNALAAYGKANKSLVQNGAFIPTEIHDLFYKVNDLCRMQVNLYPYYLRTGNDKLDQSHELACRNRTLEIEEEYKKLQEKLREYLKTLDVVDEK